VRPQPQIPARGEHRVHVGRKAGQQPGELSQGLRRVQLVQIIDDHNDAALMVCELREHPVDYRALLELGCRCWRLRPAGCAAGVTDRVEQGKPEKLGVLLVALYLDHGNPVPLARSISLGAQRRRLPAASRRRDDRHLPRHRAIQGGEKITPVDQPGGCQSHLHGPAFVRTRDALPPTARS
jgi:hypothetical protein